MTAASITTDATSPRARKYGSMSRDRRWALRWSYFFLILFAIFFMMPPVYMLITSLKTSAEISAATNPWWVQNPTLGNYAELLTSRMYLTFFLNSALVSVIVVTITMLISVPAAFALSRAGAAVAICARREKVAKELARAVGGEAVPRRALRTEFFDAILNATPVGMHPHGGISPLAPGELHCRIVMDLIYRPQRTQLLKLATQKGIVTVSGVEMFLAQGSAQWEIWTEKRAPESSMRRAVLAALRTEEKSRPR